ncbi:MAG TPA: hypothetical protein VFZ53_31605 [Polyangiaceae bacterium]
MVIAPPEPVAELVTVCLDYVHRALKFELDFTSETLPVLDHYVSTVKGLRAERPELAPLVARATGAYFGEVVRAWIPGFWRVPSANIHDWELCSRVCFLRFNPLGVAYDALYGDEAHDGPRSMLRAAPEDRDFLQRRLEALPPVPPEHYHLFTTRFEVVEVANEALRARLDEQGYEGTELTEEDYVRESYDPVLN